MTELSILNIHSEIPIATLHPETTKQPDALDNPTPSPYHNPLQSITGVEYVRTDG